MATTFVLEFNWSGDGATWVDESSYLIDAECTQGFDQAAIFRAAPNQDQVTAQQARRASAAAIGTLVAHLRNGTQRFSPDGGGPLAANLLPRRQVRLSATDGVTTWVQFRGYIEAIEPEAGAYSERTVTIRAVDAVGIVAHDRISLELQTGKRADELIKAIVNAAFGAPAASQTCALAGLPSDGDGFNVNGQPYTYRNALANAYDVKIGATKEACMESFRRAVNLDGVAGTDYHGATARLPGITMTNNGANGVLTSSLRGTVGNAYTLAKSGANLSVGGATFSGGADRPAGLINYEAASESYDTAGDSWSATDTWALDAIADCATSDFGGRFFVQFDGTVTYYERRHFFKSFTALLTLNAHPFRAMIARDVERIFNVVGVTMHPRATAGAPGVIAQSGSVIQIPPVSPGGAPGFRRVALRFVDSSNNLIGAAGVVLPLVAGTDYTINERRDGTGPDYTFSPSISFGLIDLRGSEVILPIYNTATGVLYFTKLQVRGKPVTTFYPVTWVQEDGSSQAAYQRRALEIDLPLSSDPNLAASQAEYVLDRYKSPVTDIDEIEVKNHAVLGGLNVFSVNLFDAFRITDGQSGLSGVAVYVVGRKLKIDGRGFELAWGTLRADDRVYWNLEVVGYGELDSNTRLAP